MTLTLASGHDPRRGPWPVNLHQQSSFWPGRRVAAWSKTSVFVKLLKFGLPGKFLVKLGRQFDSGGPVFQPIAQFWKIQLFAKKSLKTFLRKKLNFPKLCKELENPPKSLQLLAGYSAKFIKISRGSKAPPAERAWTVPGPWPRGGKSEYVEAFLTRARGPGPRPGFQPGRKINF